MAGVLISMERHEIEKRGIIDIILTKGKDRIAKMNSKTKLNCVYAQIYSSLCHVPLQSWTIQSWA